MPKLGDLIVGRLRCLRCGWKASLSSPRALCHHGQEIEIYEHDHGPCARLSVDATRAEQPGRRSSSGSTSADRRATILITTTPRAQPPKTSAPRNMAAVHPSLRPLGRGAPRYLQRVRRRERRTITGRAATGLLALGVLISGPTLAISSGPDASASRSPRSDLAEQQYDDVRNANSGSNSGVEAFVAPVSSPSTELSLSEQVATDNALAELRVTKFVGAYARRNGNRSWVTYPTGRLHPFLVCTRSFESDTAGGYSAVSPDGRHRGAYQFKRSTWNTVANNVGRDDLIGVDPAAAPAVDQDWMALYLYKWQGASHWEGRCAGK